jgi:phosphoglycerate dehydrogenase-like enzyme
MPTAGISKVYKPAQLKMALKSADFVVIATPLTPETRNLLDEQALAAMKAGASLINIGRAGVIDINAVIKSLHTGQLSGAILDVHAPEPLPKDSPVWTTPNLMVVPHVSSDDADNYMIQTMELALRNLQRLRAGRKPLNRIQPTLGY